jgi:hypothetical protein
VRARVKGGIGLGTGEEEEGGRGGNGGTGDFWRATATTTKTIFAGQTSPPGFAFCSTYGQKLRGRVFCRPSSSSNHLSGAIKIQMTGEHLDNSQSYANSSFFAQPRGKEGKKEFLHKARVSTFTEHK